MENSNGNGLNSNLARNEFVLEIGEDEESVTIINISEPEDGENKMGVYGSVNLDVTSKASLVTNPADPIPPPPREITGYTESDDAKAGERIRIARVILSFWICGHILFMLLGLHNAYVFVLSPLLWFILHAVISGTEIQLKMRRLFRNGVAVRVKVNSIEKSWRSRTTSGSNGDSGRTIREYATMLKCSVNGRTYSFPREQLPKVKVGERIWILVDPADLTSAVSWRAYFKNGALKFPLENIEPVYKEESMCSMF